MASEAAFFRSFLYSQIFVTPKLPKVDFTGQTVIVTGSNTGCGLEAARYLVELNVEKVILGVRSTKKGEAAKESIIKSTGRANVVEVWELDLESYESVKAFAKKASDLPRLDVLLENAGVFSGEFKLVDGEEVSIRVNAISTYLLALLLLPKLRETGQKYGILPRLSIVGSEAHMLSSLDEKCYASILDGLRKNKVDEMYPRYQTSKLVSIMYFRELAKAVSDSTKPQVLLNTVNPGLVASEFHRNQKEKPLIFKIILYTARTPRVASRTLISGLAAGRETHGKYMSDGSIAPVSPLLDTMVGKVTQGRIWSEMNELFETIEPGVTRNI